MLCQLCSGPSCTGPFHPYYLLRPYYHYPPPVLPSARTNNPVVITTGLKQTDEKQRMPLLTA